LCARKEVVRITDSVFKKKVLIVSLIVAALLVASKVVYGPSMIKKNLLEISLSSVYNKPLSNYDPALIENAAQHIVLQNIYSPLLEYTNDGKLTSAIASSFGWEGRDAYFKIRPGLKTLDGDNIDAYDVENTFKRLFILKSNTHGDLKSTICQGVKLKSLNDRCPNIEVRQDGALLVIKLKKSNTYLFPMLTAMDYAIIPQKSLDKKSLKIIDYKNTSGPYWVEEKTDAHMVLRANPHSFHYSGKMPQKVEVIYPKDAKSNTPLNMLIERKTNHIVTVGASPEILLSHFSNKSDVSMHLTEPIWLRYVSFTKRGRQEFSEKKRIKILNTLKKILLGEFLKLNGYVDAPQLFPSFSKGSLSAEELFKIKSKYAAEPDGGVFTEKMVAWFFPKRYINKLKEHFPNTEFVDGENIPCFIDYKSRGKAFPHFYFAGTDMGFQEDISLLSYKINTEKFYLTGKDGNSWIKEYIKEESDGKKIRMLKKLHYDTLDKAVTIPLVFCPYVAVVRTPWKMNFPRYTYDNNFWQLQYGE